jgi:hypothetical protein
MICERAFNNTQAHYLGLSAYNNTQAHYLGLSILFY